MFDNSGFAGWQAEVNRLLKEHTRAINAIGGGLADLSKRVEAEHGSEEVQPEPVSLEERVAMLQAENERLKAHNEYLSKFIESQGGISQPKPAAPHPAARTGIGPAPLR